MTPRHRGLFRKDCFGEKPKTIRETRALPGGYATGPPLPFNHNHRHGVMIGVTQSDPAGFHPTALG
jgi:hypothetical protein